jgi:hypothetical protein
MGDFGRKIVPGRLNLPGATSMWHPDPYDQHA